MPLTWRASLRERSLTSERSWPLSWSIAGAGHTITHTPTRSSITTSPGWRRQCLVSAARWCRRSRERRGCRVPDQSFDVAIVAARRDAATYFTEALDVIDL